MPQERDNPFPFPTAAEIEASPGTREEKSARFVISRHIQGIPSRGYLLGDCDNAPIYRGVKDLTTAAWAVLDAWKAGNSGELDTMAKTLEMILTDHGRE